MSKKPVKIGAFTERVRIADEATGAKVSLTPEQLRTELKRMTRSGNPAVRSQAGKALGVVETVRRARRRRR